MTGPSGQTAEVDARMLEDLLKSFLRDYRSSVCLKLVRQRKGRGPRRLIEASNDILSSEDMV